jgi:hypothetical protein
LEVFKRSQRGPWFAPNSLELFGLLQCGPGVEGGAAGRISATSPAGSAGEVAREGPGVERKRLGAYSHRRDGRRSGTAGADGGGRGRNHSGELVARAEQQAHGEATRDPREGKSKTRWRCKRPEGRVHREHRWRQWRLGGAAFPRAKDGETLI